MKPVRLPCETEARQTKQANIDQQHDAESEGPADGLAVKFRRPIKDPIERTENTPSTQFTGLMINQPTTWPAMRPWNKEQKLQEVIQDVTCQGHRRHFRPFFSAGKAQLIAEEFFQQPERDQAANETKEPPRQCFLPLVAMLTRLAAGKD